MALVKQRSLSKSLSPLALLATLALTSGCGQALVTNVTVDTKTVNGDLYAQVVTTLNLGGISLPALTIPIDGGVGEIQLAPVLGAKQSQVTLAVNLTRAVNAGNVNGQTLPNGNPLPLGGISQVPVVGIGVGGRSRLYLAFTPTNKMVGFALVIPELQAIGGLIPIAIDLFPQFKIANGVVGVAGFFTSPGVGGASGLAVFIDATPAVTKANASALLAARSGDVGAVRAPVERQAQVSSQVSAMIEKSVDPQMDTGIALEFGGVKPADADLQSQLESELYKMQRRKRRISVD